ATLGLLAHLGVLSLPPALEMLSNWYVIGVSVALFAIEFFADKIPAFDLVWNTLHTFIRDPVAALLAYRATETLSPWQQLLATAVCTLFVTMVYCDFALCIYGCPYRN